MSWSYDTSQSTTRDQVRWLIGDTNTSDQIFSNEEIDAVLTRNSDVVFAAAIECCGAAVAKYIRQPTSWSNQSLSISYTEWAAMWRARKADIEEQRRRSTGAATMKVGGLSINANEALADDDDAVQPWARTGIDMRGLPWR